jgi:hypothetical protein
MFVRDLNTALAAFPFASTVSAEQNSGIDKRFQY